MNRRTSHPHRIEPGPDQESVWDYPRPPAVDEADALVRVEFGGRTLAETTRALRVLETSHPPSYYLPLDDVDRSLLVPSERTSLCEFKGRARYFTVRAGDRVERNAAWTYPDPAAGYERLADHLALYPGRMDACWVGDERVQAQEGDFYGGWITSRVVGPFKGGRGTLGW